MAGRPPTMTSENWPEPMTACATSGISANRHQAATKASHTELRWESAAARLPREKGIFGFRVIGGLPCQLQGIYALAPSVHSKFLRTGMSPVTVSCALRHWRWVVPRPAGELFRSWPCCAREQMHVISFKRQQTVYLNIARTQPISMRVGVRANQPLKASDVLLAREGVKRKQYSNALLQGCDGWPHVLRAGTRVRLRACGTGKRGTH